MLRPDGSDFEKVTTIKSDKLVRYLSNKADWVIGIEASGGVNHFVEECKSIGVTVKIINPNKFRGIGIGGKKTDERDARALANALRVNFVPEVHHRSLFNRQLKSILTTREHLVESRVRNINHIRSTLREYGVKLATGVENFYEGVRPALEKLECAVIQEALGRMVDEVFRLKENEKIIELQLKELTKEDSRISLLQTIPGIGFIGAVMLVSVTDDISRFKNSKLFAAYLGLTPSIHASANVCHMGSITKSGSEMCRRYLIHGARTWMRYSKLSDKNRSWAEQVKNRRGMNKAIVALAHKMARIAFAVLRDGIGYKQFKKIQKPIVEAA